MLLMFVYVFWLVMAPYDVKFSWPVPTLKSRDLGGKKHGITLILGLTPILGGGSHDVESHFRSCPSIGRTS